MIELHRKLLGDSLRNQAFYDALRQVIVPGQSVVADIGSGTGFLSFLARQLGAKECYLYEVSEELELSRALAKANGITGCHFAAMHSTQVKHPPKVDIVLSETLGNYALEENIIETLNDAKRFLAPGGIILPSGLRQYIAPVVAKRVYEEINVWDRVGFGLDLSRAKAVCMNNMYVRAMEPSDLLPGESAVCWDTIDFTQKNASKRSASHSWTLQAPQTIYGFCVWWESQLVPGISISTSPFQPRTHWDQIFLPVLEPIALAAGESCRIDIRSDSRYSVKINLEWDIAAMDAQGTVGKVQKLDMRRG